MLVFILVRVMRVLRRTFSVMLSDTMLRFDSIRSATDSSPPSSLHLSCLPDLIAFHFLHILHPPPFISTILR